MAFSFFEYVRRRTFEAILAGAEDALNLLEQNDTAADQNAAARQLAARIREFGTKMIQPPNKSASGQKKEKELQPPDTPPGLFDQVNAGPEGTAPVQALPPAPEVPDVVPKRKRGRPRKDETL